MMDMQFEGYSFRVFKEYDNYLRELYGDYRKLPPKEERKAHLSVSKIQLLEPEDIFSKEELNRLGYYVREENKEYCIIDCRWCRYKNETGYSEAVSYGK